MIITSKSHFPQIIFTMGSMMAYRTSTSFSRPANPRCSKLRANF